MRRAIAVCALAAVLGTGSLFGQSYRTHVGGDEVEQRTTTVLAKRQWSDSLDDLLARAHKEKKLVFWMQLVGDLDGGL